MALCIIAGYAKASFVDAQRTVALTHGHELAVAFERRPETESKQQYLASMQHTFDLTTEAGRNALAQADVAAVTVIQERDMDTYLRTLTIANEITTNQAAKYTALANKRTFKQSLQLKHPTLVPNVHSLTTENLDAVAKDLTYPTILKPTGLSGSAYVLMVHSPQELTDSYHAFAGAINERSQQTYNRTSEIIVEEYVRGTHYSVNAYIDSSGQITYCPIVRVVPAFELKINDGYSVYQYVTDELHDTNRSELENAVQTISQHFALTKTSAHFDMVLTKHGWKCLEVGLRIGGNRHQMFEKSHGFSHYKNDLRNRLGEQIVIPELKGSVCVMQKAAEHEGVLEKITYERIVNQVDTPMIEEMKLSSKYNEIVKPVSAGGGTLTRHLVFGKKDSDSYAEAKRLFEVLKIVVREN